MKSGNCHGFICALPFLFTHCVQAQLDGADVILNLNSEQRITTNTVDAGGVLHPERVFGGVFAPFFTNEPGFDSEEGAFPPLSEMGFRIRAALRSWDGATFNTVCPERISIRSGPFGPVVTPVSDSIVMGFSLAVNSLGKFHHHPGCTLLSGTPIPEPDRGVYLYEADLFSNVLTISPSRPFWIVYNFGRPDAEHAAAMEWVYRRKVCPADFNLDRVVDFFDYLDFVSAFSTTLPVSDVNDDSVVDFFDYLDFVAGFSQGCNN